MRNNTTLTDSEFRELLDMIKYFKEKSIKLPANGEKVQFRLESKEMHENFYLDVNRSGIIELSKFTLQNRFIVIPLLRLDIDSAPHLNPDGSKASRNHLHIYKEGYGDTWAYDLDDTLGFDWSNCKYFEDYFYAFCKRCNIVAPETQSVI